MVLEIYIKLCVAGPDFLKKKLFMKKNLGKWIKNGPKTGFFKFVEKLSLYFLLTLFYNEN